MSMYLMSFDGQAEMPLSRASEKQEHIPDSTVFIQPSSKAAFNLAVISAGLEDQDIYKPLAIDKAQWSRIKSGAANFPNDKIKQFHDLVQNDIYIRWLAYQCSKKVQPLLSTLEEKLAAEQEANHELKKQNELLRELLKR